MWCQNSKKASLRTPCFPLPFEPWRHIEQYCACAQILILRLPPCKSTKLLRLVYFACFLQGELHIVSGMVSGIRYMFWYSLAHCCQLFCINNKHYNFEFSIKFCPYFRLFFMTDAHNLDHEWKYHWGRQQSYYPKRNLYEIRWSSP